MSGRGVAFEAKCVTNPPDTIGGMGCRAQVQQHGLALPGKDRFNARHRDPSPPPDPTGKLTPTPSRDPGTPLPGRDSWRGGQVSKHVVVTMVCRPPGVCPPAPRPEPSSAATSTVVVSAVAWSTSSVACCSLVASTRWTVWCPCLVSVSTSNRCGCCGLALVLAGAIVLTSDQAVVGTSSMRNACGTTTSEPVRNHRNSPRWPVGRRLAPTRLGSSSICVPMRSTMTKCRKSQ